MRRLCLVAAGLILAAGSARAHVVSDRDLKVVREMPAPYYARALATALPGADGLVPPNRSDAWQGVMAQCPAALMLIGAAARSDTVAAERLWGALEAAYARQVPDGGFSVAAAGRAWIEEAIWSATCCRAQIAVMNSRLQDRFRMRYALMKPKLQRSMSHLLAGAESAIQASEARSTDLLWIAAAFLLADGTFHDERYGRVGQSALVKGLALQRKDGGFPNAGRLDRLSHALALEALQSIVIYFPSPSMERKAAQAAAWLRAHPASPSPARSRAAGFDHAGFVLEYDAIPAPPPSLTVPH